MTTACTLAVHTPIHTPPSTLLRAARPRLCPHRIHTSTPHSHLHTGKRLQTHIRFITSSQRLQPRSLFAPPTPTTRRLRGAVERLSYAQLVLLTGTPVQNSPAELFSLLSMLDPERYPNAETSAEAYGELRNAEEARH